MYAVGEFLLVMIGILLALQVNTWNEIRTIGPAADLGWIRMLTISIDIKVKLDEAREDLVSGGCKDGEWRSASRRTTPIRIRTTPIRICDSDDPSWVQEGTGVVPKGMAANIHKSNS